MCIRSAAIGDVVEISYQVRVKKPDGITEELIDGPKNIAPQGNFSSLQDQNSQRCIPLSFCIDNIYHALNFF